MKNMDFRGRRVLVTGASSGLGWEMAKVLAFDHGARVVAVARRMPRLLELQDLVASRKGPPVEVIGADLAKLSDVDRAFDEATRNEPLYGAILNAGITHFGDYHELTWADFETMLATNVTGTVRLTTRLIPHLEEKSPGGGIMLVSSMAGLTPTPYQTAYSATKAFLINFGCCLHYETRSRNVSVTTFLPGGIQTEMTSGDRFKKLGGWLMPADQCAREGVDALQKRRYLQAPGVFMRAGTSLMGLIPRQLLVGRLASIYKGALEKSAAQAAREAPKA